MQLLSHRLAYLRPRLLSNVKRRALSTDVSRTYPSKVRAFPFALSAEEAVTRMSIPMSLKCLGKQLLGSIGASLLPEMGFEPFRPIRIQPVYIPIWLIDADLEAQGWHNTEDVDVIQHTVRALTKQSYMPGFVYEPLSRISLNSDELATSDTIRFTEDLLTQRGSDILCLPFTMTPFPLLDLLRSLSYQDVSANDFRIAPSSIKTNMLAAYPILVPLFLAQYEHIIPGPNGPVPRSFTAILEAHVKEGRIIAEDTERALLERTFTQENTPAWVRSMLDWLPATEFQVSDGDVAALNQFVKFDTYSSRAMQAEQAVLENRLNEAASQKGALDAYHKRFFQESPEGGLKSIDWEDLRIREYTKLEFTENRKWMVFKKNHQLISDVMNHTRLNQPDDSTTASDTQSKSGVNVFREVIEITPLPKDMAKVLERDKPEWLKEFERSHSEAGGGSEGQKDGKEQKEDHKP